MPLSFRVLFFFITISSPSPLDCHSSVLLLLVVPVLQVAGLVHNRGKPRGCQSQVKWMWRPPLCCCCFVVAVSSFCVVVRFVHHGVLPAKKLLQHLHFIKTLKHSQLQIRCCCDQPPSSTSAKLMAELVRLKISLTRVHTTRRS